MKYPCGVIRDLMPLKIDGVCGEESADAIEKHIEECEKCRKYYESMTAENGFGKIQTDNPEDIKMADSLKKIKGRINRKIRITIICAAAAALLLTSSYHMLFNMPIKKIDVKDISADVEAHPINELISSEDADGDTVKISLGEEDTGDTYEVHIPDLNTNVSVSAGVKERDKTVSVVSWSSPYVIKDMDYDYGGSEDDGVLRVRSFKTTLLHNSPPTGAAVIKSLEFRDINKIVYIDDNGLETILWSK